MITAQTFTQIQRRDLSLLPFISRRTKYKIVPPHTSTFSSTSTPRETLPLQDIMAQVHPGYFHHVFYDTGSNMPGAMLQPCFYYATPYMPTLQIPVSILPGQPLRHPRLPSTPHDIPKPLHRTSLKPKPRSILKAPRSTGSPQQRKQKSVRFIPSTVDPPPAAPGTYKYVGKSQVPRAKHPARNHPCLQKQQTSRAPPAPVATPKHPPQAPHRSTRQATTSSKLIPQRPAQGAPTPSKQVPSPSKATPQPRPQQHASPCPTLYPISQQNKSLQTSLQPPPYQANMAAKRQAQPQQQQQQRLPPKSTAVNNNRTFSHNGTDDRLAALAKKEKQDAELRVQRQRLREDARKFDKKNGWRIGREIDG